ncbi:MAG: hypothetical protein ABL995_13995 [Bryobacteraceae bacterium]
MRPPCLVFQANAAGLANRLRALVGYQALSEFLELPFYLVWKRNADCNAEFQELFQTEIQIARESDVPQSDPNTLVYESLAWFSEIWRERLEGKVPRDEFLRRVRVHLDRLTPVRSIQERVDSFAAAHGISGTLGVHIRHTDNVVAYPSLAGSASYFELDRVSALSGFLQEMDVHAVQRTILLATDNSRVEQMCARRYGARMIRYEKRYFSHTLRTSSVEDALIELLLLGRCEQILGTYYSSFSQLAAIWSGRPYREMVGTKAETSRFVDKMQSAMRST